ncbi:MAG: hypothetical protein V2A63_02320 [Patescibacteria group bacterium]
MQTKNPERFLKIAAFTIGLVILCGGTFLNAKNFDTPVNAKLTSASATDFDTYSIPTKIGTCEQSATQANEIIEVQVKNLDKFFTGEMPFNPEFVDPVTAGILGKHLTVTTMRPNEIYQFAVQDGQTTFWKCVLEKHPFFELSEQKPENTSAFLAQTQTFEKEIKKYEYNVLEQKEVDKFLNFVNSPNGEPILETTVVNSAGEVFFKIFEIEKTDTNYDALRQALRMRVGVTNLRPAVFGVDSYYWTWGENANMAASVFSVQNRIFGVSYQTIHFGAVRRVIEGLQADFQKLADKLDYLKKFDPKQFADLTISEFEKMGESDFGTEVWKRLNALDQKDSPLTADVLKVNLSEPTQTESTEPTATEPTETTTVAPAENSTTVETPAEPQNFEPIEIPADVQPTDELVPAAL